MDHQNTQPSIEPSSVTPNLSRSSQADRDLPKSVSSSQMWSGSAGSTTVPGPEVASPQLHREQLHERVGVRVSELIRALDGCDDPFAQGERARAIASSLETARVAMSGGWEQVGENEALMLSQWLHSTANYRLTDEPSTAPQV